MSSKTKTFEFLTSFVEKIEFLPGELVYVITDPDQRVGIVYQLILSPSGVLYEVAHGSERSSFLGLELSSEKTIFP